MCKDNSIGHILEKLGVVLDFVTLYFSGILGIAKFLTKHKKNYRPFAFLFNGLIKVPKTPCNWHIQDTKIFGTKVWGGSLDFNLNFVHRGPIYGRFHPVSVDSYEIGFFFFCSEAYKLVDLFSNLLLLFLRQ